APHAAVPGMMNAGKEIRKAADGRREMQRAIGGTAQQARRQWFDLSLLGTVGGQQGRKPPAQRDARAPAELHQRVQSWAGSRLGPPGRIIRKEASLRSRPQIEDHISDRHPSAGFLARGAEHSERQILDWKLGMAASRTNPALAPRIVGFV